MKTRLLSSIATIPLVVIGMVTSPSIAKGATVGSRIDFSGYVFGSSNQLDYIDASNLVPNPMFWEIFKLIMPRGLLLRH